MRIRGRRWACDRCGKLLWKADMAKPKIKDVSVVYVYPGHIGFRYTCRDADGKVVYDSDRAFQSRYAARDDIHRRWPKAKVSFEVR